MKCLCIAIYSSTLIFAISIKPNSCIACTCMTISFGYSKKILNKTVKEN